MWRKKSLALFALLLGWLAIQCSSPPPEQDPTANQLVQGRGEGKDNWFDALPRPGWAAFKSIEQSQDWFEVYEVPPGIFAIYEPGQFEEVISYLILGSEKALLFDTGLGIGDMRKLVSELTDLETIVLNSHTHYDHIGGNHQFQDIYATDTEYSRTNARGAPHEDVGEFVGEGWIWKETPENFSPERYRIEPFSITKTVSDGELIDLGDRTLEIIFSPGHSPDSLCLLDRQNRLLFTGDTFYPDALYVHLEDSDFGVYTESANRLAGLAEALDNILPSHNEPFLSSTYMVSMRDAFQSVREATTPFVLTDGDREYKFDGFSILITDPPPFEEKEGSTGAQEVFTFPAEFEPQESIWMAWPTYEYKRGQPLEPILAEIIGATEGHVQIDLIAQDEEEITQIRKLLQENEVPYEHVRFHSVPHGDIWMRDMGPIFLRGSRRNLRIADFKFNVWGYEDPNSDGSRLEERVDRLIAQELGLETVESQLISEGGNHEFNGKGTMMAVEAVERQRNPDWTLEEIGKELKRVLGQKKLIWLKEGMAEDELTFRGKLPGDVYTVITTGGHIDELARFADAHTVLLAEITDDERASDPIAAISDERLDENLKILENATCQDGHPLKIVRMAVPDSIFDTMKAGDGVFDYIQRLQYEDGSVIEPGDEIKVVAATSYLNFHITNGLVLMQTYWEPGRSASLKRKDEEAKRILGEVFPDREIVAINALRVNLGGGGLHCILQQQPALH